VLAPAVVAPKLNVVRFVIVWGGNMLLIVKRLSLVSEMDGLEKEVILTLHLVEGVLGMNQARTPSFGVSLSKGTQVIPLLVVYSILTLPIEPVLVQVILYVSPEYQDSPPLGEVTVRVAVEGETMENRESLVSEMEGLETQVILTLQLLEGVLGMVQGRMPSLRALASKRIQVLPLLVVYSSLTLPGEPVLVQVMFWLEPTGHDSPPLGEVIVMVGPVGVAV
jgi:hypothetical protein